MALTEGCPVLEWAASGGMALTGHSGGLPSLAPAAAFGLLGQVTDELAVATGTTGLRVRADPAELIAGRAALAGFTRQGQVSAGGTSRLLRCADGWCAVTLSRPDDLAAIPALLGLLGLDVPELARPADAWRAADAWAALAAAALTRSAAALADDAQLLGVPAAALPPFPAIAAGAGWPPWQVSRIAGTSQAARLAGALVVDLSSMWAGPLCARLLGLAGARVVKVETPDRPDGARTGNQDFFDWLHAGHQSVVLDFRSASGRDALGALLAAADVVIEASRPRALAQVGLAPSQIPHRDGQVWLSITGYGRGKPDRVAFGDDAAVAGGLVAWVLGQGGADHEPVFCADAVADPLTGLCGALAVARSLANGGGQLIDLPMRTVAAGFGAVYFAADRIPHPGSHQAWSTGDGADAIVRCDALGRDQAVLPPSRPAPAGRARELGADTAAVLGHHAPG
jgi:crotonobetainyl-CoA:carnitine CoA-transferase CaiB-like acyl-CoA transferase